MGNIYFFYYTFIQLILFGYSQEVQYNGSQCPDVYDFNLASLSASTIIDTSVSTRMDVIFNSAPYIETACVRRLRKHYCMISLYISTLHVTLTASQQLYCKPECFSIAYSECSSFIAIAPELVKTVILMECDSLPSTPQCYNGSLSSFTERDPICPYPTVIPNEDSYESPAQIEWIPGSACAVPCPGLLFDENNWNVFSKIVISLYLISCVFVSLAIYQQLTTKYKNFNVLMVCIGCMNGVFWMFVYHLINNGFTGGQKIICNGNAGYVESDPFCIFCGFMLLVSSNWFASWSFFTSLNLWLAIANNYTERKLKALRPKMFMFSTFLSLLPILPLGAGNIGYEWTGGTLNMCLNKGMYTRGQYGWHYAITLVPLLLLVFLLPLILLVDTLRVATNLRQITADSTRLSTSSLSLYESCSKV